MPERRPWSGRRTQSLRALASEKERAAARPQVPVRGGWGVLGRPPRPLPLALTAQPHGSRRPAVHSSQPSFPWRAPPALLAGPGEYSPNQRSDAEITRPSLGKGPQERLRRPWSLEDTALLFHRSNLLNRLSPKNLRAVSLALQVIYLRICSKRNLVVLFLLEPVVRKTTGNSV